MTSSDPLDPGAPDAGRRPDRPGTGGPSPGWVDLRSATALTGISRVTLAWALADGDVRYTTTLPGHEGVPMLLLTDVRALAATLDRTGGGSAADRDAAPG
jgi:hypothetical protein